MMKLNYLLLIIILLNSYYCYGFENLLNPFPLEIDDFKNSFDTKLKANKRNINETAGSSESFVFNGLEKYESVPILFPQDICLFNVGKDKYVSCIHKNNEGNREFAIFKYQNNNYLKIFETPAPFAVSMDCKSIEAKGFIALAFNLTEYDVDATEGSPIIEISDSGIKFVQFFTEQAIEKVQFLVRGNHLYLLQIPSMKTGSNIKSRNTLFKCPIFKWTGTHFNQLDEIPCENTKHIEMFLVNSQLFLAVANYADADFETMSIIHRYNLDMKKFELYQKIKTFGAIDVKYFNILLKNGKREHFLVFANSRENGDVNSSEESYSVIYKYDVTKFVPFEKLLLYSVSQFLPVQNKNGEFILLISCENQDIKILEYNGWKFEDAAVQITEGALSGGIVNLRTFEDHNETFIVVANQNMLLNETNIYRTKFKKFIDIKSLKKDILEWSERILSKISKINVLALKQEVEKQMAYFEKTTNDIIQFEKANISQAVVRKLHYYKKNMTSSLWDTLKMSYKTVKYLEAKLNEHSKDTSNDTKYLSGGLNSLSYEIKADKNITEMNENDRKLQKLIKFERLINGSESDALFDSENLFLKTLIVNKKILAKKINNVTVEESLSFNNIVAKKIITLGNYQSPTKSRQSENNTEPHADTDTGPTDTEPMDLPDVRYKTLKVKNLKITGAINEIDFHLIYSKSIKKFGNQVITAPMTIKNLKVNHIRTDNNIINTLNTSKLVLINKGKFVINQDIQFAAPVIAKHVQVNDRINNIHVHQGHLDVLLKNSETPQLLTGIKNFENVNVLEPIILDGKLVGKNFDKISPIKLIDKDILLEGNYTIIGDVSIESILSTNNLYDHRSTQNVKEVIKKGIKLNASAISIDVDFKEPIYIENLNAAKINSVDLSDFVKTGTQNAEFIKGRTTFKSNLTIEKGYFEVFEINRINVEELENQVLNKFSDQNITYRFRTTKLSTSQFFSDKITLGSLDLSEVLTRNTKQNLSGNVQIQTLKTNKAEIENLQTGQLVNNINFQKILNPETKEIYFKDFKEFRGNVNAKYLIIKNSINGIPMALINPLLEQLGQSITFFGPIQFANGMRINKVEFNGTFNGIASDEFGKNWLLSETNQVFTAPQKFSSILCDDNVGSTTLNNIKFYDFIANTYWLNRNETLKGINYENTLISKGPVLSSGKINNLEFNKVVLKKNSKEPQKLNYTIKCNQNVQISGNIKNEYINEVDLKTAEHIIRGNVKKISVKAAIFEHTPKFETLNLYNVDQLLEQVWMTNEDTLLNGDFEFDNVLMKGEVEINGQVNYNDLNFIKDNYFSLSKDQDIITPIHFTNEVIFNNSLKAHFMDVKGLIIDSMSEKGFSINEFAHNVLTKTGDQIITGHWNIEQVNVEGNLQDVTINGLGIKDDVVRLDIPSHITAKKIITNGKIYELFSELNSKINDVNINIWIENAVLIDNNCTIYGTTVIDDLTVFNDIEVIGKVNGIIFNENNLLLNSKNQTIYGDVHIITKNSNTRKILPNTIKNLMTDSVNRLNVKIFFENLVQNTPKKHININSVSLIFKNKLEMETFDGANYFYDLNTEYFFETLKHQKYAGHLIGLVDEIHNSIENIGDIIKDPHYYLSHFQHKQTIFTTIKRIISLKWTSYKKNLDVLAILQGHTKLSIDFFKWDADGKSFVADQEIHWNPTTTIQSIVDISKIKLNGDDVLLVQTFNKEKFQHLFYKPNNNVLENIYQLSSNHSQNLISDEGRDTCIIAYSELNSLISKLCLDQKSKNVDFIKESTLLKGPVKKLISIKKAVFTLVQDALQIWDAENLTRPLQRIVVHKPNSFVTVEFQDHIYIAVCFKYNSQSLYKGSVEIYKSLNNTYFVHAKTLDVISPIQIEYLKIPETNDLLLYVLTENISEPLVVYKFRGILIFEKILGPSTVPKGTSMTVFNTQSQNKNYFTALQFNNGVALVETVINSN